VVGANRPDFGNRLGQGDAVDGAGDRLCRRRRPGQSRGVSAADHVLDPAQAPASDLAAAYLKRWEIESVFDELKTHQRGPRAVLRSKSPDLVQQEIWGHLCCHYAIRTLMTDTALHTGHDPDRVSFVKALRVVRRSVTQGSLPPSAA